MQFRQLAHFLAVVDHGSLGRAAKVTHISEPALSKSLRRLEEELNVTLLDRGTKGMTPTLFGEALLPRARLIIGEIETCFREMEELRGVRRGVVRVGARPSFGSTILPQAIARIQRRQPNLQAVIREGFMPTLISEVIRGQLDFIVVTEIDDLDPVLVQELLFKTKVALLVRADHPLTRNPDPRPADIRDASWVMPLTGDPIRSRLEGLLTENGIDSVNVVAESNSLMTTMSYVRASDAIAFFPKLMIESPEQMKGLALVEIPGIVWQRRLNIVRRRRTSLPPAARLLIEEVGRIGRAAGLDI